MKLSTAIRRFDEQMRADCKSPHTRQVYLRDLRLFRSWLRRDVKISTVTPRHLARFLTSRICAQTAPGKPKATISINRTKSALRSFFAFLVDAGYIRDNPSRLIGSGRTNQKPPSVLSAQDVRRLLATINRDRSAAARRDRVMFSLLLGTGMRLGSLIALRVEDIDLVEGTIRVQTKGGVERVVFVSLALRRQLRHHLRDQNRLDEPVFRSTRAGAIGPRQVQLRFAAWTEKAGITKGYSVHSLRHTFATRLYEATKDLRLVQVALGHRHVSTTEIYTQVADSAVRQAVCASNIVNG